MGIYNHLTDHDLKLLDFSRIFGIGTLCDLRGSFRKAKGERFTRNVYALTPISLSTNNMVSNITLTGSNSPVFLCRLFDFFVTRVQLIR